MTASLTFTESVQGKPRTPPLLLGYFLPSYAALPSPECCESFFFFPQFETLKKNKKPSIFRYCSENKTKTKNHPQVWKFKIHFEASGILGFFVLFVSLSEIGGLNFKLKIIFKWK